MAASCLASGCCSPCGHRHEREEAPGRQHAHTAWNTAGGDFAPTWKRMDVTSRLSAAELADCFSTALHQENLGVIWERLGI